MQLGCAFENPSTIPLSDDSDDEQYGVSPGTGPDEGEGYARVCHVLMLALIILGFWLLSKQRAQKGLALPQVWSAGRSRRSDSRAAPVLARIHTHSVCFENIG